MQVRLQVLPLGGALASRCDLQHLGIATGAGVITRNRCHSNKDLDQARIDAGRKKRAADAAKPKITDVTPKGYGPNEDVEDAYDYKAKKGAIAAPGSGSIAKAKKAKVSDVTKSIEQQMAAARQESIAFQEGEWDQMWKNAAKSKPKMSFKQASEFVDEVGLEKKEKTNALKTAKKWLR